VVLLFLAFSMYLNYWHGLDREYLNGPDDVWLRRWRHVWVFGVAFLFPLVVHALFTREWKLLKNGAFWAVTLGMLALYAYYSTFRVYQDVITQHFDPRVWYFLRKCVVNLTRGIPVMIPILVYWWFVDRKSQPYYGFRRQGVTFTPYWIILAMVAPLVFGASFLPDFLQAYPRYTPGEELEYYGLAQWQAYLIFELCYGWDFVFTEFFFRGFLILGMARFLGPQVFWPMASFYCYIHFGKPLGETLGSIFGGYVLGVIAYRTGSIYGGILVHLGVAWLMELTAFLQKFVLGNNPIQQ
jgi:membrane protease YdiL (CAAX protease family)